MNAVACRYAIVRFAPFVETGEFANAGIVLLAPTAGFFGHEIQTRRHARISGFFDLDPHAYKAAMSTVRAELDHFATLLRERAYRTSAEPGAVAFAHQVFDEIIRPREGIIRYSDARVVMAADPGATLRELFLHYVERSFATREYQEAVLERGLHLLLARAALAERFEKGYRVGDQGFHVTFPLVETRGEVPIKAIKALNLAQNDPSKIRDHALVWGARIEKLRARRTLPPRVLFAVSEPGPEQDRRDAYEEAISDLRSDEVQLVPARDQEQVLVFARG